MISQKLNRNCEKNWRQKTIDCRNFNLNLIFSSINCFLISVINKIFSSSLLLPPACLKVFYQNIYLLEQLLLLANLLLLKPMVHVSFRLQDSLLHVNMIILLILKHLLKRLEMIILSKGTLILLHLKVPLPLIECCPLLLNSC